MTEKEDSPSDNPNSQFPYHYDSAMMHLQAIKSNLKIISDFRCNDSPDFEITSKLGREVYNFLSEFGICDDNLKVFKEGYHHVVWHCITTYEDEALVKAKLITILTSAKLALDIRPLFSGDDHNLNEIR